MEILPQKSGIYERLSRTAIKNFAKRNISASYVRDREEALSGILSMIPEKASVGVGDSVTMRQIGVMAELKEKGGHEIFDPFTCSDDGRYTNPREKRNEKMRQSLLADVFLTGSNAITLDGKIVNIDGHGNRVAGIIFGPKKVIIAVGANKIAPDLNQALNRIKNIAAPMNAERHFLSGHRDRALPCQDAGRCVDCSSPLRICCFISIIEWQRVPYEKDRINLFIVGEELGL